MSALTNAELADWRALAIWGGTPEVVHEFIRGQQNRIYHCQDLETELAALRHSEENLAATVRGLEFELEKAEKATAMLRGTVEALGDANDRLTIEVTALRKEVRRE